ncbi:MAG: ankyrin repeat domain-containing protein [Cyanobacteria bacterium]|nr:ankyrin repeat domain-containing protein [Cyanobacteriota bacterium]
MTSRSSTSSSENSSVYRRLQQCWSAGDIDGFEKLILDVFDVNKAIDNNRTALWYAVYLGSEAAVSQLLKQGADANIADTCAGWTPLHLAARTNRFKLIPLLLKAKASVNCIDHYRQTPLIHASVYGYLECIKALLSQSKIDINAADDKGNTALILAAGRRHSEVVHLLMENKANRLLKNHAGKTAIDCAANQTIRSLLLEKKE